MRIRAILNVKTRNGLPVKTAAVIAVVLYASAKRPVVDYPVRTLARRMSAQELGGCDDACLVIRKAGA